MLVVSQIINGLQLGSIYALVALGYSMVYGIIKLLNFAHGDIIMAGGYVALFALTFGMDPITAGLLTVAGCTILAVVIEKLAYTPLRNAPRLSLLITAIGVSILLQNLAQYFFSASGRSFPASLVMPLYSINIGGVNVAYSSIATIVVAIVSMILLHILVRNSKMGKAMRAVSQDAGAAQLMGVNVNHVITFTFAIGAALAGVGALLYAVRFPLISPTIGAMLGLKAFVAAVFGGIGSIPGAMLGGFTIGMLEVMVVAAGLSGWVDGVVFLILIIMLMVRPTGIMGRKIVEKV